MSETDGQTPAIVLGSQAGGKRAGAAEPARSTAAPPVWTKRMLTTLDEGVEGGKWYSLIDKVYRETTLHAAFEAVSSNDGVAGVDHVSTEQYGANLDVNLARLGEALRADSYRPQAIRRHYIPKPGSQEKRPLGIPTVQDRVVQTALRMVIEPIFERDFAAQSYGFRPGRGCKDALRRVDELLKSGHIHVVDADLRSYFDTIPKDRLLALVAGKIADRRILSLVQAFLEQGVLDGAEEVVPEQGTPQGAVISPLLSNIYLDPLDHLMAELGFEMVRYADDFVVLCRSPEDAAAALAVVQEWTARAGLALHPDKTRLVDARIEGFDFLGYRFQAGQRWPREKSLAKFKDTVRAKTRRTVGRSLASVITDLNPTLRGWFEYFKHSHRWTFSTLDGWIRRRLRSILRKQQKRQGVARANGADQTRWPNAFFDGHGLFSLQRAYEAARQSS
jgi:RNA-directed DNA polymerase